jgi:hypothetical protein
MARTTECHAVSKDPRVAKHIKPDTTAVISKHDTVIRFHPIRIIISQNLFLVDQMNGLGSVSLEIGLVLFRKAARDEII